MGDALINDPPFASAIPSRCVVKRLPSRRCGAQRPNPSPLRISMGARFPCPPGLYARLLFGTFSNIRLSPHSHFERTAIPVTSASGSMIDFATPRIACFLRHPLGRLVHEPHCAHIARAVTTFTRRPKVNGPRSLESPVAELLYARRVAKRAQAITTSSKPQTPTSESARPARSISLPTTPPNIDLPCSRLP